MKELFNKSLDMIKVLNIKSVSQYNSLQNHFLLLSVDSMKYIAQTTNFKDIVKMASL
jgi:hypothetical protein